MSIAIGKKKLKKRSNRYAEPDRRQPFSNARSPLTAQHSCYWINPCRGVISPF